MRAAQVARSVHTKAGVRKSLDDGATVVFRAIVDVDDFGFDRLLIQSGSHSGRDGAAGVESSDNK
jgi:hypothetical protein